MDSGKLSSLCIYSGKLAFPVDAFIGGLADHAIITTLCPGGNERMRQLMGMVRHVRLDLAPLLTHRCNWTTSWRSMTFSAPSATEC